MTFNFMFFLHSILLAVGLAMDAFSVSLVNGLNEPTMKKPRMCLIAGCYGFFQFIMPMVGWICVHTLVEHFKSFQKFIPWIAFGLLTYIGVQMLIEGIKHEDETDESSASTLSYSKLFIQGIATSIDALSVGFTIADYNLFLAIIACVIIAVVTYFISLIGVSIGKKAGTKLSDKASILGGSVLIFIGILGLFCK